GACNNARCPAFRAPAPVADVHQAESAALPPVRRQPVGLRPGPVVGRGRAGEPGVARGRAGDRAGPDHAGTPEDRARQAILSINPDIQIDAIAPAPLDGFSEVVVGGQALYVSDDGKYLLQGSLFDIEAKRDVSQAGVAEVRRRLLAEVPASERIVFAPANP